MMEVFCHIQCNRLFLLHNRIVLPVFLGKLNDFYISSVIDKNGYYKTTTLDIGKSYYGMISINDDDKDAKSITITQTRKSDSYLIGPAIINVPSVSEKTFFAYAEFTPDLTGIWDVSVFASDSNGNKSNTLTLQVEVWESGKYIITFDGNGATSGTMEKQTLSVGEKLQANQFVKEGYLFSGWNRAVDGADVGYENEEEFAIKHKGNDIDYHEGILITKQFLDIGVSLIEKGKALKWISMIKKGDRQSFLSGKLKYFIVPIYLRRIDNDITCNLLKLKVVENAKRGKYADIERTVFNLSDYKWTSELLCYQLMTEIYKKNTVVHQYRPYFLKSEKGQLSYDVFVFGKNIALEYQGKQHFEPVDIFGGKEAFEKQKERDFIKKKISEQCDVHLIYVNYWENITKDLIKKKIKEVLR